MEQHNEFDHSGEPVGPEFDDSVNPTNAAPGSGSDDEGGERPRSQAGREMLVQLQQMIDTLATQAGPVMREVAAKSAELAAIAAEKAGPLAYKAAGVTQTVSERVAARSKEMAADLRRGPGAEGEATAEDAAPDAAPGDASEGTTNGEAGPADTADWPADPPRNADD
jgi:hypothetical protein